MSKLRPQVAVFSLAYDPFVGGAEIAVREIIRRLPDTDFTVLTRKFDRSWPPIESSGNYSVVRLGRGRSDGNYYGGFFGKISYIFSAYRFAARTHKANPFSAVWAVMASYAGIAALFFKLRHPGVPLLLTLQEGDSEVHILNRVGIFYPLWKLIFKKADYIQAISNFLADFAKRHGAHCPVEVVPNGVDLEAYENTKKYESTKNKKLIITTSRLVEKNGIDILIAALSLLYTADCRLLILGDGPDKEKLKDFAAKLGVADKIEFLGHVEPDQIPHYLLQATIFARASRSEGLGNSFLEAMAAGLPVIGTPVGGIPDFLKDGETGIFCKVDDPKDLAEKIKLLINDDPLRRRVALNGRRLVEEKYSWDKIAVQMKNIFQKLCV
ncbi:MAG: glycosyltransferase family 4 protein [Patescibacteria group bacterium]